MSYNENGSCCGGWGGPFGGLMGGFGGFGFDALILLLFFGLMGGGMWGGMGGWGGWGGFGGGAGMLGTTSLAATETAALINQQNTADRVAAANAKADAIAGIVTANGVKIETVKDQNNAGFANLNTHLCEGFHSVSQQFNAQTMQGMNMHNATTALLNDMRAEQAKCCCESKTLAQAIASQAQYQAETNKGEIIRAIDALGCRFDSRIDALERSALQDKLAAANERNSQLKSQLDRQEDTSRLLAAIQANGCNKPACAPYGPAYPYGFCNPCVDGVQRAVNDALGTRIGELLFPTTTPATA